MDFEWDSVKPYFKGLDEHMGESIVKRLRGRIPLNIYSHLFLEGNNSEINSDIVANTHTLRLLERTVLSLGEDIYAFSVESNGSLYLSRDDSKEIPISFIFSAIMDESGISRPELTGRIQMLGEQKRIEGYFSNRKNLERLTAKLINNAHARNGHTFRMLSLAQKALELRITLLPRMKCGKYAGASYAQESD